MNIGVNFLLIISPAIHQSRGWDHAPFDIQTPATMMIKYEKLQVDLIKCILHWRWSNRKSLQLHLLTNQTQE